jgi:N-acetylglucosaminyldiphosphoundecaprenol N-acetyl-beta-D-mannosaminyltransferase
VLDGLKSEMTKIDPSIANMRFEELPYCSVDDFDYEGIAAMINEEAPDIVWISLGAPKQEQFMYRLKPYLKRGVMFGVGAIFNFYSGLEHVPKRAPKWMIKLGLEWLHRLVVEPSKQSKRVSLIMKELPKAIKKEYARKKVAHSK